MTGKSSAQVIPGDDPQHAGMKLDDCLATGVLFLRNSDQDDPEQHQLCNECFSV